MPKDEYFFGKKAAKLPHLRGFRPQTSIDLHRLGTLPPDRRVVIPTIDIDLSKCVSSIKRVLLL